MEDIYLDDDEPNPEDLSNLGRFKSALKALNIKATVVEHEERLPFIRFELELTNQTKIRQIEAVSKELALKMKAVSQPLISSNYKSGTITVEMMFDNHPTVLFKDLARTTDTKNFHLPLLFGVRKGNQPLVRDLTEIPHLLIAGTTGSGKSTLIHSLIASLTGGLGSPAAKLCLLDPKMVEFRRYEGKDFLAYSVGYSTEDCLAIVKDLHKRMNNRFAVMSKAGCLDIVSYRKAGGQMPFLVVVVDELSELVRVKAFEKEMIATVEKSRAAGIFWMVATQHPSRNVVSGNIKANFPGRVGLLVSSAVDSRVALDAGGAEKLNGRGDALLVDRELRLVRFQIPLIEFEEPVGVVASESKGFFSSLFRKKV